MKKKILLKSLVAVTPLVGVLTPLASCATTNVKELFHNQRNNDSISGYCPIIVDETSSHTINADLPLPIPNEGETLGDKPIKLTCDNPIYVVKKIQEVRALTHDGEEKALVEDTDYSLEIGAGFSTITFKSEFVNGELRTLSPYCIRIIPKIVAPVNYEINIFNPLVELEEHEPIADISKDFSVYFSIKDEYKSYYTFDEDKSKYEVKLGHGKMTKNYKTVNPTLFTVSPLQIADNKRVLLRFPEGIDLSEFDPLSDTLIFNVTLSGASGRYATVKLFGADNICVLPFEQSWTDTFNFYIPPINNKEVTYAEWKFDDGSGGGDCHIEYKPGGYVEVTPETPTFMSGSIIIDVMDVGPFNVSGQFENEPWEDLGYWVDVTSRVNNDDDGSKLDSLRYVYDLNGFGKDFLGREKTVNFGGIEHKVVVVSQNQAKTVVEGHEGDLILDDDEYDDVHHATLTFQFKNLLTRFNDDGEPYVCRSAFDNDRDKDSNCWVEQGNGKHFSSDIRNYLRNGFISHLQGDSANLEDIVRPTASQHYSETRPHPNPKHPYICDTFFIPTAVQMNGDTDGGHNWVTEPDGEPVFQLYEQYDETNEACECRVIKPAVSSLDTPTYWLATPCDHEYSFDYDNDVVVNNDGSLTDIDQDNSRGILVCFCV